MGQNESSGGNPAIKRFPKNFSTYPPAYRSCLGPGLLEDLDSKTRDILPKCFEGAHLKVRKKLSKNLDLGYNMTFSAVTPSGAQLASDFRDKRTDLEFTLSPSGATALHTKVFLSPSIALDLDTQLQWKKHSVGTISIQYSKSKTTTAISLSACKFPFKSFQHDTDILKTLEVKNNILMTLGLQYVRRIANTWILGTGWNAGQGPRLAIGKRMRRGWVGVVGDQMEVQAYWWRQLAGRLAVGGTLETRWDGTGAAARVGGSWRGPGTVVKASIATDGLVACTIRTTLFQGDSAHFALKLSGLLNHRNNKFRLGIGFEGFI